MTGPLGHHCNTAVCCTHSPQQQRHCSPASMLPFCFSCAEEGSLLPALPPGVVPLFGSAAGSSNSAGSRVGGASAIAAAAAGADQQLSARAASPLPPTASTSKQQLLVPNTGRTDRVNSGFHSSSTQHQQQEAASAGCQQQQQQYHPPQVPKTLALAPANTPEPVLLAVSPRIPPNLQRRRWCLADFVLHKKLYDGYASTIYKVRAACIELAAWPHLVDCALWVGGCALCSQQWLLTSVLRAASRYHEYAVRSVSQQNTAHDVVYRHCAGHGSPVWDNSSSEAVPHEQAQQHQQPPGGQRGQTAHWPGS